MPVSVAGDHIELRNTASCDVRRWKEGWQARVCFAKKAIKCKIKRFFEASAG